MAGCAGSMLLTGLSRISPEIQDKIQGKNCWGAGPSLWQDAGPQFPAGLLFLYGMFLCGTGLRSADHPCIKPQTEPDRRAGLHDRKRRDEGTGQDCGQGRAGQGGPGPAHVNPVISHRHPDICADETRGRAIPPARAGADPRPGKNGVAPANRTGPVKPGPLTGSPDRRRDLPDLMRSAGAGIPRAGQPISGHGVSGHGDIRRQPPDLRNTHMSTSRRAQGFLPLAMPGFLRFFLTGGIAQIPAQPLRRFSRAFRGAFRFGKIPVSFQISVGKKLINGVNVLPGTKI